MSKLESLIKEIKAHNAKEYDIDNDQLALFTIDSTGTLDTRDAEMIIKGEFAHLTFSTWDVKRGCYVPTLKFKFKLLEDE